MLPRRFFEILRIWQNLITYFHHDAQNTNNAPQKDSKTILPAEQDPPQFTDHSDTKINEINWSYYQKISQFSDRRQKFVNRYKPASNTPQKRTKVVQKNMLALLHSANSKPCSTAKIKKKQVTQSAPSKKRCSQKF